MCQFFDFNTTLTRVSLLHRLKGASNKVNTSLLDAINKDGSMFLIATELSSQHTIRLAIGSTNTQLRHVQAAWLAIQDHATAVLTETLVSV